jgi:hypothetical protein
VFWRLNGGEPLAKKKTDGGRAQRVALLKPLGFDQIENWLSWRHGTGIGRDDLIDACARALAARDSTHAAAVCASNVCNRRGSRRRACAEQARPDEQRIEISSRNRRILRVRSGIPDAVLYRMIRVAEAAFEQ